MKEKILAWMLSGTMLLSAFPVQTFAQETVIITGTQASETVASTETIEPVTSTATPEPVENVATVKPVTSTATPEPVASSATVEPVTSTATPEAVENVATVEPVTSTATAEPVASAQVVEPVISAQMAAPQNNTAPLETEEFDLTVTGGTLGTDYTYENNTLTILTSTQLTISGTTIKDKIVVSAGDATANIILNGVDIQHNDGESGPGKPGTCAFKVSGTANITLAENSVNTLRSGVYKAGLQMQDGATIEINGTGELKAFGGHSGTGIGCNYGGGDITINGGTITASGGSQRAGIGGGSATTGVNVTINGGTVTASGGFQSAAIGSGYNHNSGNITITGGTVTAKSGHGAGIGSGDGYDATTGDITISGGTVIATSTSNGAGIGGGNNSDGGNITITGGTVTASGSAGIGGGNNGGGGGNVIISGGTVTTTGVYNGIGSGGDSSDSGTFSTGENGTAIIKANNIQDQNNQDNWNGIIFEDKNGAVYGDQTLSGDLTIAEGETLTVGSDTTLTVPSDKTLTNNGTIANDGTLANSGTLSNSGTLDNHGTLTDTETGTFEGEGTFNTAVFTQDDIADIPDQAYTGAEIEPKLSINIMGKPFDISGWVISYTNNINVGTDTATVTLQKGEQTFTKQFSIVQSETTFEGGIKTYKADDTETTAFNYSDIITVKVTPKATGVSATQAQPMAMARSFAAPTTNQMALFVGETQIAEPQDVTNGTELTFSIDTNDHLLSLGENTITAKYVGNDSMADYTDSVTITLSQYTGDFNVIGGTQVVDFDYKNHTLTILTDKELTISGTTTKDHIVVDAKGTTANITLSGVDIQHNDGDNLQKGTCAFAVLGTANITLADGTENTLKSGSEKAGLQVQEGDAVTIISDTLGTGKLDTTGGDDGAGIGGGSWTSGGNITIDGGTVTAKGGYRGASIGGGLCGSGGEITINGGSVTATSDTYGAGIGGGHNGSGGTVTISGGTVTAKGGYMGAGIGGGATTDGGTITIIGGTVTSTGGSDGAGIGGGNMGDGGNITISGGTVTATGGNWGTGIGGDLNSTDSGTFSTGKNGTAIIKASSISDNDNKDAWQGVIFEGDTGAVYGNPTLSDDLTITADETLTINPDTILTIADGKTLTNSGTLINNGTLTGTGTLSGDGKFIIEVFTEDDIADIPDQAYTGSEIEPAITISRTILGTIFTVNTTGWITSYKNNTQLGTATVTLTKGDVKFSKNFNIKSYVGDLTVTGGEAHTDFDYSDHTLTILTSTPLTISGTTTTDHIVVKADVTANITLAGVDIQHNDGDYYTSGTCAFAVLGKANITLADGTENTLKSGYFKAGLQVQTGDAVTISGGTEGTGTLTATGGQWGAGIGSGDQASGGTITISGGIVTATGGYLGAGIGGGHFSNSGSIIINDGTVTATGGLQSAGIGGGYVGNGGTITIRGGTVTATGGTWGAGIGGGWDSDGGTITINGGTVTAKGGDYGAGIGSGKDGDSGTFSTGKNGTAIIKASSIQDYSKKTFWQGIIFENGTGVVYGNQTLSDDLTIENDEILTVKDNATLTVPSDKTLTINTTLQNDGALINNGSLTGTGTLAGDGKFITDLFTAETQDKAFIPNQAYTGKAIEPDVITGEPIMGKSFTLNKDIWAHEYTNNTEMGEATVTFTKGNVKFTKNFNIKSYVGDLTVTGGEAHTDFDYSDNTLTILTDTLLTISGTTTTDHIVVADGITANIILSGVDIQHSDKGMKNAICAFEILGTANITLADDTTNTLKSGYGKAGLQVKESDTVTIGGDTEGTGVLNATGGQLGAGIGGDSNAAGNITVNCGKITINGGIVTATGGACAAGIGGGSIVGDGDITISGGSVTATGGDYAAGIGGGSNASGGRIIISGGTVTATGGYWGAGIGGGYYGDGGTITIDGGIVTATGGDNGAGIGGGWDSDGGTITINGGTVTAKGGDYGAGIGSGKDGDSGTFSTGKNGTAIIKASSIQDDSKKTFWQGIIFENGTGVVYGNQTLSDDLTITTAETLTVNSDITLTVPADKTLTIDGTLQNDGALINNGTLIGTGTLAGDGKFIIEVFTEDDIADIPDQAYTGSEIEPAITISRTILGTIFTVNTTGWITSYKNNTQLGTATVTLTKGDVKFSKNFNIKSYVGDLTVTGGEAHTDFDYSDHTLTILTSTPLTISGTTTTDHIVVKADVTANITLSGVDIQHNDGGWGAGTCAFEILGTANITLVDGTENTLQSGFCKAGLQVQDGDAVTIIGETKDTGILNATGGSESAGIGGGYGGSGGTITICGGTVHATGGYAGAGIGGGSNSTDSGTFSTGKNGTAIIKASSISDKTKQESWQGIIFEDNTGAVYGNQTLSDDLTIENSETLTINPGTTLTIASGNTLTNSGTLYNYGALTGAGTLAGNGTFEMLTADCIKDIPYQPYTGNAIKPDVTPKESTREILGKTFTVSTDSWAQDYENNKEIGIASVTFTKGNITIKKEFHIIKTDGAFTVEGGTPNVDYSYKGDTLTILTGEPLTISGKTTTDHIVVAEGATANITLAGADIQHSGGDLQNPGTCAFEVLGTANITLADGTTNTLKSGFRKAGLQVEGSNAITINGGTNGTGSLTATGGDLGAGIGGGYKGSGGTITISGGTVNATGGNWGAGIGGGYKGSGGTIIINDGTVTATSSQDGAGIGGGTQGSGGTIIINDGTVTATGSEYGAGIGGGDAGSGGTITINDGSVTATGGDNGAGIGGGGGGSSGTFSTGENGTAIIKASSISDQSGKESAWQGIIFEGNDDAVYGNQTLLNDLTIENDEILTVKDNATLTVPSDKTLTINTTLQNDGALINNGSLTGTGTLAGDGKFITDLFTAETQDKAFIPNQAYTGKAIEPDVITGEPIMGKSFTLNKDIWAHEYTNNTEMGEATVTFTKGNVAFTKSFTIKPYIGDLIVTGGEAHTDFDYSDNTLTILTSTPLTISGKTITDRIVVKADVTANITLAGVDIQHSGGDWENSGICAFEVLGTANITLADGTTNTLKSGFIEAGLQVEGSNAVTIRGENEGTGILNTTGGTFGAGIGGGHYSDGGNINISGGSVTATSGGYGAGIGGGESGSGGTITISGGIVHAAGGECGAGIGGGHFGSGGTITISGGTVTATSDYIGAGIGGGRLGDGGTITITDGSVTASGGSGGAGIGGGNGGDGGTITINGGTVTATGGTDAAGIGGGMNGDSGTFSTGESGTAIIKQTSFSLLRMNALPTEATGTAIIKASSISDQSSKADWQGIIFEGGAGIVYGNQTLSDDLTIESKETLTVNTGITLTIADGKTLTNSGTLTNNGTLQRTDASTGTGKLAGNGKFLTDVFTKTDVVTIPEQSHTGEAIEPEITISRDTLGIPFIVNTEDLDISYDKNTDVGTANVTITNTKGDITVDTSFEIVTVKTTSVTITWGSMNYSYDDGTWNPETHEYADGTWVCEDDSNKITVENNGSGSENVSLTYNSNETFSNITGTFTDENAKSMTEVDVGVNVTKIFYLALTGKPTEEFATQSIGNITIQLGGNE